MSTTTASHVGLCPACEQDTRVRAGVAAELEADGDQGEAAAYADGAGHLESVPWASPARWWPLSRWPGGTHDASNARPPRPLSVRRLFAAFAGCSPFHAFGAVFGERVSVEGAEMAVSPPAGSGSGRAGQAAPRVALALAGVWWP